MLVTLHHVEGSLERFEFETSRPQGPYIGDVLVKPLGHPVCVCVPEFLAYELSFRRCPILSTCSKYKTLFMKKIKYTPTASSTPMYLSYALLRTCVCSKRSRWGNREFVAPYVIWPLSLLRQEESPVCSSLNTPLDTVRMMCLALK